MWVMTQLVSSGRIGRRFEMLMESCALPFGDQMGLGNAQRSAQRHLWPLRT